MSAYDTLWYGTSPPGVWAGWRLAAPAGTRITAVDYIASIGKFDPPWAVFLRTAEGVVLASCEMADGVSSCMANKWGGYLGESQGRFSATGLSTGALELGVRCDAPADLVCIHGATQAVAWATIHSSRVTIEDPDPPTLTGQVGGTLLGGDAWMTGVRTVTAAGSDVTGIRAVRVYVDGVVRAETELPCDFTRVVPCGPAPPTTVPVDTTQLADGTHTVQAAVADAAGNERRAPTTATVTVDNTPPASPSGLTVAGGPVRAQDGFEISWTLPAGQVAPIVAVRWQLCPISGSGCSSGRQTSSLTGMRVQVGAPGSYRFRVWAEDAAGHHDPARAAETMLRLEQPPQQDPPAPQPSPPADDPPPAADADPGPATAPGSAGGRSSGSRSSTGTVSSSPAVRRLPRLTVSAFRVRGGPLRVRGTITRQATGRLRVTVTGRATGRRFTRRVAVRPRAGRFAATVRLPARARDVRVAVRYPGDRAYRAVSLTRRVR